MFSIWTLALVTSLYVLALFAVAVFGNKIGRPSRSVYALALGVHCTSWAFFGTTTQALNFGWALMPTYLGVILVMLFAYSALLKIANICRQYKISSLAEFIGIRYQHSNVLAGIVVALCFVGVIPYIALQLDAISSAIALMTAENSTWTGSISFYVTAFMALFAIWFGTNTLELTKKRDGLMFTIAFESVLKLAGLLIVGLYCVYVVSDGWIDLFDKSLSTQSTRNILTKPPAIWVYASHILLGVCSMFCLPRQFHINFVENNSDKELALARWVFPMYLLLMSLFILPIALTGQLIFDGSEINSDNFVLSIPIAQNNYAITLIAFIGGLAASTSMVIVATLALGNMVANNLLTPIWLTSRNIRKGQPKLSAHQILRIRQGTIVVLLFIAYWYHQNISQSAPLVKSGTIAIALMAQTLPAIMLGIYWSGVQKLPILIGMLCGTAIVTTLMLYPAILSSYYFAPAPSDQDFAFAIFLSLGFNTMVALAGSLLKPSNADNPFTSKRIMRPNLSVPIDKLSALMQRILPQQTASDFLMLLSGPNASFANGDPNTPTPTPLLIQAERTLASHVGNASSRILLNAISDNQSRDTQELTELVEMATQSFQFNHEVLQSSIAHLPQGISVVDSQLNLVAWNRQYEALFDYPSSFLRQGLSVAEILNFNAHRGLIASSDIVSAKRAVEKRLSLMRKSEAYKYIRQHSKDKVIEISGNPLPGGGYITSFTDITEYIKIQQQLEASKADLELRVQTRTQELEQAKIEAEQANISKTKFLAATGHDLMQPFNAATLFASMLHEKLSKSELHEVSSHLVQSLENADQLLSMLIEITKLETGKITPSPSLFALDEMLQSLANDFAIIGEQKGIRLRYVSTSVWVKTDKRLLSRAIQNLLANAIRYTQQGTVLLGVRRREGAQLEVMVVDTGPGIAKDNQAKIFNEFQRLEHPKEIQGLGLGLTIVERTAQLLGIQVTLSSAISKGTSFGLLLDKATPPLAQKTIHKSAEVKGGKRAFLLNKHVLVLENEQQIATALSTLLADWGATISFADDKATALAVTVKPDLIIADYHLNNNDTGTDVCAALIKAWQYQPPMILSSADRSEYIQEQAISLNMRYLPKPIKSAALKRLIQTRLNV
ncbi:PAS-domain containing protein [Glaciecola sp. XM2]|uniref:hybrid sensor histidine kinase/response regulator n=1 Tax=Glaciecola sp. XM2 TaxID=1914931 RepID=UPI001BDF5C2F|nr:PAS-domain containing protein [Glaciecola sp. XM2]MBT1450991.1 PAS-domain containing protein [Glaciecola sp. XM2]